MDNAKKLILLIGDIATLYLALAVALLIRYQTLAYARESFAHHVGPFSALFIAWILACYWNDLYRPRSFGGHLWLIKALARTTFIATAISITALYLFPRFFELTPRTNLFLFALVFFFVAYGIRTATRRLFAFGALNTIVLGTSPLIHETIRFITAHPHVGYRVVTHIAEPNERDIEELVTHITETHAQIIVISPRLADNALVLRAIYRLLPLEVSVMRFSDLYERIFEKEPLKELEEGWLIENIATRRPIYESIKRAGDIAIAMFTGALLIVPALVIALLVKFTSRGPIIFSQERAGKNGTPFTLYKFRTMRHNNGESSWELWTKENDARITPVGKFLRFTHLDELPQLINIAKGDIALVGPRPERTELAAQFAQFPY